MELSIKQQIDREAALLFLQQITQGWEDLAEPVMLELRCLFPGKTPSYAHFSPDETGLSLAVDHAEAMNGFGLNIYPVINPVLKANIVAGNAAKDADIAAAFWHWADSDEEASTEALRGFAGPRPNMVVLTGSVPFPRPHAYWRIADGPVTDLKAWRAVQEGIAATLGTDRTVVNASRIMRLPGMVNWPTKDKAEKKGRIPEIATMAVYEDREPVPFGRMQRTFGGAVPAVSTSSTFSIDTGGFADTLDRERTRIQALDGVEWHNAVIKLVASYVSRGLSDAEIHGLTDPLTLPGYTVDDTRREVQTAIDGARRKGWTPEQYATPEAIVSNSAKVFDAPARPADLEWFDDVEPALADSYLVKGVLGVEAMSVIYGPSNSGKTFFALDLAYSIAIGAPWRGRRVKQASVLYLAAEGGRGVVNRIAALKMEHGVCDVPLALKRAGLDLLHAEADLQHIVDLAAEVKARQPDAPQLIVIDTLSRIMAGGDENSAADMTALIRNIDGIRAATGAHIALVHHTGKDTARGARGHSSLRAATDTEIEVGVVGEDGEEARAAMVTKQRDYQGGETFAFTLKKVELGFDQDGDEVSSCVVESADAEEFVAAKKAKKSRGKNQKLIMEAFDQMLGEGYGKPNPGGVGFPEPGQFWCVDVTELRRVSQGKMVGSDTGRLFRQAWEALTGENALFVVADNLTWRIDRRKR